MTHLLDVVSALPPLTDSGALLVLSVRRVFNRKLAVWVSRHGSLDLASTSYLSQLPPPTPVRSAGALSAEHR